MIMTPLRIKSIQCFGKDPIMIIKQFQLQSLVLFLGERKLAR